MKKLAVVVAATVAALGFGAARAQADGVTFGVNDNAGLYGNTQFWSLLKGENMSVDTIILRWNETTPDGFDGADGQFLPKAIAAAQAAGVTVEFAVSPRHSAELSDQGGPRKFAAWLTQLAQTYPQVTKYVVMNECNQDLFVNPQMQNGQNISAAECGTWLAAGYDALKAVNANIFVWGLGLSPRGNVPSSVKSTNPIDFLNDLGQWYRQSGRTKPLMDGLDLHPYPIPQSLPFAQGYGDPHDYSIANLSRAYQAFYNAFNGTAQPTVGPGRLPVQLNEVGIQTVTNGHSGYTDSENAAGPSGGVSGATATEAYQADWYRRLVDFSECDADITNVNIFKLIDETSLLGWQSGLYYADGAAKQSASVVRDEIAGDAGKCPTGAAGYWTPGATTVGGISTGSTGSTGSTAVQVVFDQALTQLFSGLPSLQVSGSSATLTFGKATQNVTVTVSLIGSGQTVSFARRHVATAAKPKPKAARTKSHHFQKGSKAVVRLSPKRLKAGQYALVATATPKQGAAAKLTASLTVNAGSFVVG